jgi:hypothetical protein
MTFTLVAATSHYNGMSLWIMNASSGNITIALASGDFIGLGANNATSYTLASYTGALFKYHNGSGNNPFVARYI